MTSHHVFIFFIYDSHSSTVNQTTNRVNLISFKSDLRSLDHYAYARTLFVNNNSWSNFATFCNFYRHPHDQCFFNISLFFSFQGASINQMNLILIIYLKAAVSECEKTLRELGSDLPIGERARESMSRRKNNYLADASGIDSFHSCSKC